MEIAHQGLQLQNSKVMGFNCSQSQGRSATLYLHHGPFQRTCSVCSTDWGMEGGGGPPPPPLLLFDPLFHPLASSGPTSVSDSIEGSGPATREGKETGVKMAQ